MRLRGIISFLVIFTSPVASAMCRPDMRPGRKLLARYRPSLHGLSARQEVADEHCLVSTFN